MIFRKGFIDGRLAWEDSVKRLADCPKESCCKSLPESFSMLIEIITGESGGGDVVLHCTTVTMTKQPDGTWTGSSTVSNCYSTLSFVFTCDDTSFANPRNCKEIFGLQVNGSAANIESCCCFNSDSSISGVDAGEWCFVFGLATSVDRQGDGTGCNCNEWIPAHEDPANLDKMWAAEADVYGDTCCQPSPCPDDCCPSFHNCTEPMAMFDGEETIPEELSFLREIEELVRHSKDTGEQPAGGRTDNATATLTPPRWTERAPSLSG